MHTAEVKSFFQHHHAITGNPKQKIKCQLFHVNFLPSLLTQFASVEPLINLQRRNIFHWQVFPLLYFPGASTLGQALKTSKYSESSLQRYVTCALTGEQTFLFNECSSCSSVIKSFVSYRTFLIFLKGKKLRLENTLRYQVTWFLVKILKLAWICYNYCIKINLIKLFWKQLTWSSLWQRLFSYLCLLCSVLLGLDVS